jgi:hypothetical protein
LIFNLLNCFTELARTSRGKPYSGLIAPLEKTRRRSGENGKKSQPPPGADPGGEEYSQNCQADDKHHKAALQSSSPFFDADIRDTNIACH